MSPEQHRAVELDIKAALNTAIEYLEDAAESCEFISADALSKAIGRAQNDIQEEAMWL